IRSRCHIQCDLTGFRLRARQAPFPRMTTELRRLGRIEETPAIDAPVPIRQERSWPFPTIGRIGEAGQTRQVQAAPAPCVDEASPGTRPALTPTFRCRFRGLTAERRVLERAALSELLR